MRERFLVWFAGILPRGVVYWCAIRLIAYATVGRYSDQVVPELTALEALKRWQADDPVMWNPFNKVVQDHRDGTINHQRTNVERHLRGLPIPWTPQDAEIDTRTPAVE